MSRAWSVLTTYLRRILFVVFFFISLSKFLQNRPHVAHNSFDSAETCGCRISRPRQVNDLKIWKCFVRYSLWVLFEYWYLKLRTQKVGRWSEEDGVDCGKVLLILCTHSNRSLLADLWHLSVSQLYRLWFLPRSDLNIVQQRTKLLSVWMYERKSDAPMFD